jgi:hypothetical protein
LNDTFPLAKRGMAFAVYGIAVVVAPTIGPWLGGYITDSYSWRWIFYINVPVGILSIVLTYLLVSDPPYMKRVDLKQGFRIDYVGLGLISLGLASMQIVLDKGQREDWFASTFAALFWLDACRGHCRGYLGTSRRSSGGFQDAQEPQFCDRHHRHVLPWFCFVRQHHADSGDAAGASPARELGWHPPGGALIMLSMPLVGFLVSSGHPPVDHV